MRVAAALGIPFEEIDLSEEYGEGVMMPMIDVVEVGAGGGSIAWRDAGGGLNVGPRSAGAEPGPACYGRGGTSPTVTDANLVLGRLSPDDTGGEQLAGELAHGDVACVLAEPALTNMGIVLPDPGYWEAATRLIHAAGAYLVPLLLVLLGALDASSALWTWIGPVVSLAFLAATGAVLIWDL